MALTQVKTKLEVESQKLEKSHPKEALNLINGKDFPNLLSGGVKKSQANKNQGFFADTVEDQR